MNSCKNCGSLDVIKNNKFEYKFEEGDDVEVIQAEICNICGCIHWEDERAYYWEFISGFEQIDTSKSIKNWSRN